MPLRKDKIAAFDVETGGTQPMYALQPFRLRQKEAWINSSSVAWYNGKGKITSSARRQPSPLELAADLMWAIENDITLVGWNMAFDVAWLISVGLEELVCRVRFLDAMLLWQHLERQPEYDTSMAKKRSWSLKAAVTEYFPQHAGYEALVTYSPQTEQEWDELLRYNRMDTSFTLSLARIFYDRLEAQDPRQLRNALIEAKAIVPVAQQMVGGLEINVEKAKALRVALTSEIDLLGETLAAEGVTDKVLASPQQLSKLLYEDWKLPVMWTTPKGAPSTDKVALYLLAPQDPRAETIKQYREHSLNRTKFCDKLLESVEYNGDGRSRPAMRIYGTYTGRATFASSQGRTAKEKVQTGFAIHQMKNHPDYRGMVEAPPGYTLVEWDASGQEYRWMAVESNDATMLALCEPGEDPHSFMGSSITSQEYAWIRQHKHEDGDAKLTRKMGKVGNLSCQFRIGYKKLHTQAHVQFGMPISLAQADRIHRAYHSTYPGVRRYWQRKIAEARRKGYAETIAGRRVQLLGSWASRSEGWKLESTAVNFPIQGAGADQKYLAIAVLQQYLRKWGGYFYFELHDGLYAILPDDVAMKAGLEIRRALSRLPYRQAWGVDIPVPMPFDMKIGKSWGDLTEVEDDSV